MVASAFEVKVVVSGQPVDVRVEEHQTLRHLVDEALDKSGNRGQSPENWDLRTAAGSLLALDQTVQQAGIEPDAVLYLNPKTSSGG